MSKGATPALGSRSIFVGIVLAALLAFAYMATAAVGNASARDIVISDSSSPLSAGAAGPNFAGTAITPGAAAQTQSGSCTTPNVSILDGPAPGGVANADDVRLAIQAAVDPASLGVQAGDNVYFCNVAVTGTGTPAANTYAPDESGTAGLAIDLSVTPSITIGAFPGQTPTLQANAIGDNNYSFFVDGSTQGRDFTFQGLTVTQGGNASDQDGGFLRINNAVNPGNLVLDGIVADGIDVDTGADGGVVQAENIEVLDSEFGTTTGNTAAGNGGAIDAAGDVVVVGSVFEGNLATTGDGGAIAADGVVEVIGDASEFIGDGTAADEAGGSGGGIFAQSVLVANDSLFGVDTDPTPDVGAQLEAAGAGGAIATANVTAGCADDNPATPCVPGVVEVTGAAVFGGNLAGGAGGAIYADGGATIDGDASGVRFDVGNDGAGGGAIALGGLFDGANTVASPRACVAPSAVTNIDFTGQVGNGAGGGAVHVLTGATDTTDGTKTCAVDLTGNTYTANKVVGTNTGGAVQINGGTVDIGGSTFTGNLAGAANAAATTVTLAGFGGAVATGGGASKAVVNDTASTYSGNIAGVDGGAVLIGGTNKEVNISQVEMANNEAAEVTAAGTGGALAMTGGTGQDVTVSQALFADNTAGNGGALSQAGAAGTLEVSETDFETNSVGAGTAAAVPGAGVPNSPATGNGGAVYLATTLGGTAETLIEESEFIENSAGTANGWGGAVFQLSGGVDFPATATSETSNTVLQQLLFEGNEASGTASGSGGAIASVAFGGNPAGAAGPPVIPPTFNMLVDEVVLVDNSAQDNGGAINLGYTFNNPAAVPPTFFTTPVLVTNSEAEGNRAIDGAGGTVYGDVASAFIAGEFDPVGQSITENGLAAVDSMSGTDGGAVASIGGALVLIGSEFAANKNGQNAAGTGIGTAAGNTGAVGGAVSFEPAGGANSADYLVLGSQFVGNESAKDGGAIYTTGNGNFDAVAGNYRGIGISAFAFNAAGKANTLANQGAVGGAVAYASGGASTQVSLSNLFIANGVTQTNTNAASTSYGGAIGSVDAGTVDSYRNTFASNEVSSVAVTAPGTPAAAAGAIYAGGTANVNLVNSTFNGNNSSGPASVAWVAGAGTIDLANATIAGNGSPLTGGSLLQTAAGTTGTIEMRNSIVSEGLGVNSSCAAGTLTNNGGNVLTEDTDCGGTAFVGGGGGPAAKVTPAELDLQPLANNGNVFSEDLPLSTMALGFDSVARTSSAVCTGIGLDFFADDPVDERGLVRPDTNCSSGAYQLVVRSLTVSKAGAGSGTVVSDPAGIDCGPGCQSETGEFAAATGGTQITLTATAEAGSEFQSWTGNCAEINGNVCVVDADSVNNVTANFSSNLRRLTVAVVGNGDGGVTSSPAGIDCGTTCEGDFELGTTVTLTATATGQSAFAGWSGACASAGLSATCQVTMDQARQVSASFTQSAAVRISKVRSGTIRVPRNRVISVGKVTCVNGTCSIEQATARVRVRGKTYRANVRRPSGSFTTGQSRTVKVVVPKAAFNRLTRRKSGSVTLVLRAKAQVPGEAAIERNRNISNGLKR